MESAWVRASLTSQSVAPTSRRASKPMSKRRWRVQRSASSSSSISRSMSSVPSPTETSEWATKRLRELKRLLPLPWAKRTTPRAPSGRDRSPSSTTPSPTGTRTGCSSTRLFIADVLLSCAARHVGFLGPLPRGPREKREHLFVRRLREVLAPDPHPPEGPRPVATDGVVPLPRERLAGGRRRGGHSDHEPGRLLFPQCRDGRAHRGARRDAVIHENDGLARDAGRRTAAAAQPLTPQQLTRFSPNGLLEHLVRHAQAVDHLGVHEADAAAGERPHGQLLVARDSELANHEDIQGSAQVPGDLEADGDSAPWQGEHDDVRAPGIRLQGGREHLSPMVAISIAAHEGKLGPRHLDERSQAAQRRPHREERRDSTQHPHGSEAGDGGTAALRLLVRVPAHALTRGPRPGRAFPSVSIQASLWTDMEPLVFPGDFLQHPPRFDGFSIHHVHRTAARVAREPGSGSSPGAGGGPGGVTTHGLAPHPGGGRSRLPDGADARDPLRPHPGPSWTRG